MSPPGSADNTLNRPRMDQSGPTVAGYNENTLPYVNRHGGGPNEGPPMAYVDDRTRPYEQGNIQFNFPCFPMRLKSVHQDIPLCK